MTLRLDQAELFEEAEQCRLQALAYLGTREASFLLRVAREFDHLAEKSASGPYDVTSPHTDLGCGSKADLRRRELWDFAMLN